MRIKIFLYTIFNILVLIHKFNVRATEIEPVVDSLVNTGLDDHSPAAENVEAGYEIELGTSERNPSMIRQQMITDVEMGEDEADCVFCERLMPICRRWVRG